MLLILLYANEDIVPFRTNYKIERTKTQDIHRTNYWTLCHKYENMCLDQSRNFSAIYLQRKKYLPEVFMSVYISITVTIKFSPNFYIIFPFQCCCSHTFCIHTFYNRYSSSKLNSKCMIIFNIILVFNYEIRENNLS